MCKFYGVIQIGEWGSPLCPLVLTSEEWKGHNNADTDSPNYELVKIGYELSETLQETISIWDQRTYFNGDSYCWEKWLSVDDLKYHYNLTVYHVRKILNAQKKNLSTRALNQVKLYRFSQVVTLFKMTPEVDFND